jgi:polyisoprenoid-binding protein YceI
LATNLDSVEESRLIWISAVFTVTLSTKLTNLEAKGFINMKKGIWIVILLFLTTALSGCFALQEPEEASGTAVAPTIAADTQSEEPTPESEPEEEVMAETVPEEPEESEAETEPEASEKPKGSSAADSNGATTYDIDASRSEARFTIMEVLRGSDTTVVGSSNNLAGKISIDMADPAATQIGEILINARDFATDNDFRNRAIANEILLTDTHEFITFTPSELVGLPDSVAVGESYDFQIVGDLTIIGETREVTFDVTVTTISTTELQGVASVSILYADYGVTVPLSQFVTAVDEEVLLELDFVAAS